MTTDTLRHWREVSPSWILLYEEALLQGLAATLTEGARVVNIGAGAGTSACALLRGMVELEDAGLLSIDLDTAMLEREKTMVEEQGLDTARLMQWEGESATFGERYNQMPLDLVFIDGAHSYQGVVADLAVWAPHIKPGGLLVCHDYGDPRQTEVTRAIDEWRAVNDWLEVARALYCVAFLAPGGDQEWRKGRL